MSDRLERLVGQLPERNLDAMLISAPENRRYLSGFTGSAGYLLITPDRAMLFTDSRYTEQASDQAPDFEVVQVRGGWGWLVEQIKETGVQRVGFESRHMTVANYENVLDALKEDGNLGKVSLVAASDITEEHRVFKDPEEMALLQKAIDASDSAMEAVCPTIQEGMTEKEVAWRMEMAMREFGADGLSFDTIVAAGPNGAMAHHMPSDRPIQAGEPIVIDIGAIADGYCSDITRTVVVGEPDERLGRGSASTGFGDHAVAQPSICGARWVGQGPFPAHGEFIGALGVIAAEPRKTLLEPKATVQSRHHRRVPVQPVQESAIGSRNLDGQGCHLEETSKLEGAGAAVVERVAQQHDVRSEPSPEFLEELHGLLRLVARNAEVEDLAGLALSSDGPLDLFGNRLIGFESPAVDHRVAEEENPRDSGSLLGGEFAIPKSSAVDPMDHAQVVVLGVGRRLVDELRVVAGPVDQDLGLPPRRARKPVSEHPKPDLADCEADPGTRKKQHRCSPYGSTRRARHGATRPCGGVAAWAPQSD